MKLISDLLQPRGCTIRWQARWPYSCCTGLFIMRCVRDTNVAGLKVDVALKLDMRMVGVGGHYLPTTG